MYIILLFIYIYIHINHIVSTGGVGISSETVYIPIVERVTSRSSSSRLVTARRLTPQGLRSFVVQSLPLCDAAESSSLKNMWKEQANKPLWRVFFGDIMYCVILKNTILVN